MTPMSLSEQLVRLSSADDDEVLINRILQKKDDSILPKDRTEIAQIAIQVLSDFVESNKYEFTKADEPALETLQGLVHMIEVRSGLSTGKQTSLEYKITEAIKIASKSHSTAKNIFKIKENSPSNNHIVNQGEGIENVPIDIRKLGGFKKTLAALKIQKKIRENRVKFKLKHISPEKIEIQKQRQYSVPITTRIRQPLEDLSRHLENFSDSSPLDKAKQALAKAAKLGTYEKFNLALRSSFIDTLETIFESPSNERKYVIIADEEGKSSNWAIAHLQDIMTVHPPTDIISRNNLEQFLRDNPDVHHVVMVDDCTYSGEQASRYLRELKGLEKDHHLHVTIPYMTNFGKQRIIAALQEKRCDYFMHDRQIMLLYGELYKMGVFAHTGKVIINFDEIKKISPLNDPGLSDEIIVSVNQKLKDLQKMESLTPKEQHEHILDLIFFLDAKDMRKVLGDKGEQLKHQLFKCMRSDFNRPQEEVLSMAYKEKSNSHPYKTPSWFSHKGADNLSTNYTEMIELVGNLPIEPYKEGRTIVKRRREQIERIHITMGKSTIDKTVMEQGYSWLTGRVDFVQTNRGFFLLGNSYIQETRRDHLILHINGKLILLGGEQGEYQYKLKTNDVFTLEDPETGDKVKLRLEESGKLIPIPHSDDSKQP